MATSCLNLTIWSGDMGSFHPSLSYVVPEASALMTIPPNPPVRVSKTTSLPLMSRSPFGPTKSISVWAWAWFLLVVKLLLFKNDCITPLTKGPWIVFSPKPMPPRIGLLWLMCTKYFFEQIALCVFQSFFWHVLEQYPIALHLPHLISLCSGEFGWPHLLHKAR